MKNYNEALQYIHSLGMYSVKKAVDMSKMEYLCELLGNPPDCFDVIHVAGTNGKGSTTAMLYNIVSEMGYKTGKYISPFISRFNERISVEGKDIPDEDITEYANFIKNKISKLPVDLKPNEFEFITLMSFLYYRDCKCDIVILETGLGGRLDPTNAVRKPLASVITSIDFDHTEILGDTIEKIAYEKCGIIKRGAALTVLYPLNEPPVIKLAKDTAREKNNIFAMPDVSQTEILRQTLECTRFKYKGEEYKLKLIGEHQIYNAVTSIETILNLTNLKKLNNRGVHGTVNGAIFEGLANTFFSARFEILSRRPLVIFDGAHNISAVNALSKNISMLLADKEITLLCGMLEDKNPRVALREILRLKQVQKFVAVPVNSKRACSPKDLCRIAADLGYCKDVSYTDEIELTLNGLMRQAGENGAIICFGSLYLAESCRVSVEAHKR